MPQRDPYSSKDPLEPLYRQIEALNKRVQSLENKSIPTVPKYDPTNFPQDSVEGQLATASPSALWAFIDSRWVPISGRMPWLMAQSNITGMVSRNGILVGDYVNHSGLYVAPLNSTGTVDTDVFDYNPPTTEIDLLVGGLYLIVSSIAWYEDWGTAFNVHEVTATGPAGPRVPVQEIIGSFNTQDSRAPQSAFLSAHQQIILTYWGVYVVDSDATGVKVKQKLVNASGSNRTYSGSDPGNIATLTIIQLSASGESNP